VTGAEQQHGLALQLVGADAFALGKRVQPRHRGHERLVVERRCRQAGVWKRLGHDRAIEFAVAQHLEQFGGEVLLQHQRHLRHVLDRLPHQIGQQVRADRVDHAESQRAADRVFAALGDSLEGRNLLDHRLRLANNFCAQRGHAYFAGTALKQLDVEFFFELFDRHTERGLRDKTSLRCAAEMFFTGDSNDVAKFSEGHEVIVSFDSAVLGNWAVQR